MLHFFTPHHQGGVGGPHLAWLAALAACFALPAAADEPVSKSEAKEPRFIRLRQNDAGEPAALETVIAKYRSPAGVEVDLIGAVHIGDKEYYEQLNKAFAGYEAVLYELVSEPDAIHDKAQNRGGHPVAAAQIGMTELLGLAYQLDAIDYKQPNLVHADLSPAEFSQAMAERNEDALKMLFRGIGYGMATQREGVGGNFSMLFDLFSDNRTFLLKRSMAAQLAEFDGSARMLEGEDGSAIVTARNDKALKVLQEQIGAGKKHLAVFYGAAHLEDMDRRLETDFGMRRVEEKWLTAWSLEEK